MKQTLLITGVTGFIGSRLASRAQSEGHSVRALARREWTGAPFIPHQLRFRATFPLGIPREAFQDVDAVIHAAAETSGNDRLMHAINVETTVRLAQIARDAGVRTFIFLSSQSARADAASAYGRTKLEAEQELLRLQGIAVVVLRPGLVVGSKSGGLFGRMARLVDRLPVVPLLGGGKTLVQPIHVDDLCDAILTCVRRGDEFGGSILQLGDPTGTTLKDFLQAIAVARTGRRKRMISIPITPLAVVIGAAEKLHIPLPISRSNLEGARSVRRMETAADLLRLAIPARPIPEMLQAQPEETPRSGVGDDVVPVLLIGAGRIGLVHAVTLSRLPGVTLAGLVDSNPAPCKLLRGMGVSAPDFRSLDHALNATQAQAAVIATPPSTHLALARRCLERGLSILVEKPLAKNAALLSDYEKLAEEFPDRSILTGYVMPKNPQVRTLIDRLKAGEFGRVQRFVGAALLSFVQERKTRRWEVRKEVSGGGAFINSGGHVLSMIRAAFGEPRRVAAETFSPFSAEVEDALVARIDFDGFSGTHYCSWSIGGYPRQENILTIWTDRGRVIMTGSVGVFLPDEGLPEVVHQLDFDIGFNLAPDYAGAGFTTELLNLRDATRIGGDGRSELKQTITLERLLFRIYDAAAKQSEFTVFDPPESMIDRRASATKSPVRKILDLRDVDASSAIPFIREDAKWAGYEIGVDQIAVAAAVNHDRLRVTVPDFLNLSRLLAAGRNVEVIRKMGIRGGLAGVLAATPRLMTERGPTFWIAAIGMLGAALSKIPSKFSGTVLLHGSLADFALSLKRLDMLEAMLRLCRSAAPRARIGVHANLASDLVNALSCIEATVDDVSILTSPRALEIDKRFAQLRTVYPGSPPRLTAEVGLAPWSVHRFAAENPEAWAHGADAVLVGYPGEPQMAAARFEEIGSEWLKAFPGMPVPEGVL